MTNPGDGIDDEYIDPLEESAVILEFTKLLLTIVLGGIFAKAFTSLSLWLYTTLIHYSLIGPHWPFTSALH